MNARAITPTTAPVQPVPTPPSVRSVLLDIALNAIVPVLLYEFSKHYISPSELTGLIIATLFPIAKSAFDLVRHRTLDPISVVVLLGIIFDGIAIAWGGSPRLLLLRESIFTGALGLACFVSLLLPRPLIFYFGRYFMAGNDERLRRRFDASWSMEMVRRAGRSITLLWGAILVGELCMRIWLVFTLPAAWVLFLSPFILGALTLGALVWTLRYANKLRHEVTVLMDQKS